MQNLTKTTLLLALVSCMGMNLSQATLIKDDGNNKQVGQARWHKTTQDSAQSINQRPIPANNTSVFFLRKMDKDDLQTSANISINDRFQTSLQPGRYSHIYNCSGINQITAQITGHKNNDLLNNALTFNLEPNTTYYFNIDIDEQGNSTIEHITQDSALQALQNMKYQTHQITRIVPDCLEVQPPTIAPAQNNNQNKQSIALNVLFDSDKANVQPQYYPEIQKVADYMQQNPNATVTIEGYTDDKGNDQHNLALSQRRVDAVKQLLISQYHITPDRLNSIGYGETHPIADNSTEQGRQQNRRVKAIITHN